MLERSDYQGVATPPRGEPAWRAGTVWRKAARTGGGIAAGLRARTRMFLAVATGVLALEVLLPPAVLSAARRPVDYFTFNPWLPELPRFLAAGEVTWQRKLGALPNLALFWFSADSPYGGTDWGFAVTVSDLARFVLMALLFGAFFALLAHCARGMDAAPAHPGLDRKGGAIGVLTGALGFSSGGCTVIGCGAPVIPVVGLAFTGLTSGTLAALAETSRIATAFIFVAATFGVVWLGWLAGEKGDAHLFPKSL